jgi:DNA-directed RNA polymerase specialized sigma24 family protein
MDTSMAPLSNSPCPCDSEEGVEKLKKRDEQTWEQLIRCYSGRLQHDIMTSLLKRSMPDWSLLDIEQETWMIADKRINQFRWRGPESLYHWLRVISLYRILSRLPRAKLTEGTISLQEIDDPVSDNGDWFDRFLWHNTLVQDSPENELISREERTEYLRLLLADEDRTHVEIAIMRWVEGKKPQALAGIFGIDARVISRILWSLRKRLGSLDSFLKTGFVENTTSNPTQ